MRLKVYKFLLILLVVLAYNTYAENDVQSIGDIKYQETHIFSREENIKNFQENYNKIEQHIVQRIIEDKRKSKEEVKKDLETFETIKEVIKQSYLWEDISKRDILFNNVIFDKVLFGLDYKESVFIDDLFEKNKSSKIEELISSLSFITKNNWEEKVETISAIGSYMEKHKEEREEIENAYKNFKENENELIKIFSEKLACDRYDINDYNLFVNFYKRGIATRTPIITQKLFRTLFGIVILIFIIKAAKNRIYEFLKIFNSGKWVEEKKPPKILKILKIIYGDEEGEEKYKAREQEYKKLITDAGINYSDDNTYNFIDELKIFIKIFNSNKRSTISVIVKNMFQGFYNILYTVFHFVLYYIALKFTIFSAKNSSYYLWMKQNNILFHKFYIITNFIKSAHKLYMLCRGDKNLKRFLNKDLTNIQHIFETQDENMHDIIERAINSPEKMSTINPYNIYKVSSFIHKFDKLRKHFINVIVEFISFKNYINALKHLNGNSSFGQWAIPSIVTNSEKGIHIHDLYNPMLNPAKTVGNDICFNKNRRAILLFGTNGGGKTQLEQALGAFFLFLNAYGICPCKKAKVCTIDYICFLQDITTDIAKNFSKFKNEIFSSLNFFYYKDKIEDYYKKYKKGSKPLLFNITDELLEGTSFKESTKALRNYILNSLKDSDVFLMVAHHNPHITKIAKNYPSLKCVNAYMGYNKTKNGLEYTYKLMPGLPKDSIVELVVKKMYEEGSIYDPKYILTSLV